MLAERYKYEKRGEDTLSDEKWNRFAATGSVRDYLEYRACFSCEEPERGYRRMKKSTERLKQVGAQALKEWTH